MKLAICVLALIGAVSCQKWGGPGGYNRQNFIPAPLANDGRVIDTPEIEHAKAAHFAAFQERLRNLPKEPYGQYRGPEDYSQAPQQQEYNRPRPQPRPQESYRDEDYNNYDGDDDYRPNQEKKWRGPPAKIEFTEDGKFIKDTPEVAHAKQQHFAALQAAKKHGDADRSYGYEGETNYDNRNSINDGRYRGEGESDGQYRPGQGQDQGRGFEQQGRGYEGEGQRLSDFQSREPYFRPQPNRYY